jgi:spermidine/putrescine transport system permease protein
LLVVPLAALVIIFFVAPFTVFVIYSFLTAGLFSVSLPVTTTAYGQALSSSLNWHLAGNSIAIGLMTAAASTVWGMAIAYWLRYRAGRWQLPILFLITASMFASYLVRIYAWRTVLGANGVINRALIQLGVIEEPMTFLLYNWFSVIVALLHIFLPYSVLVLFAAFRPLELTHLEAAQDLGAGAFHRWRRVILPLMAQPLASVFLFVFVLAASDYVTPQLIGGTGGQMLGVQIQSNFKAIGNWPLGAATAILTLVGFVVCFLVAQIWMQRSGLSRIRWST